MACVRIALVLALSLLCLPQVRADESKATEVDGLWKLVDYLEDGARNEGDIKSDFRVVRKNGVQEITKGGKPFSKRKVEIDSSATTKRIDFIDEEGARVRGVYELTGDLMRVAILADAEKRKTDRPGDIQEAGNIVAVYERLPLGAAKEETTAPKTLADAVARLEGVLGRNDTEGDQHEWKFPLDSQFKTRPDPAKAEILSTTTGVWIIGRPFGQPEAVSFDAVMHWQRKVFDLDEKGAKAKQTRSQTSHNVTRYSISRQGGEWRVTAQNLSNGVHESVDTPALLGAVKWRPDGFELVGSTGLGKYYGAEGKTIPGVSYSSTSFKRQGDILTIKQRSQPHRPAKAADGTVLAFPDFAQPFGALYEQEFKSEPLSGK